MAVQIETQGQLAEFLEILSRRRWQLLLPALLILTLGASLAVFIPKKFLVVTQVEVRPVNVGSTGKEAENAPNQIRAYERIIRVLEKLKNPAYLALQPTEQNDFVKDVQNDLKVKTDKPANATSSFVTIEYTHVDVHWAMDFVRALRDDWRMDVLDRDRNRASDEETHANEAVAALEDELKKEEAELTRIYQNNKISATQPIPGGRDQRTEDPNYDRLQKSKDLKAQYELDLGRAEQQVAHIEKLLSDTPPTLREEQLLEGSSHSADVVEIEKQISAKQDELATYKQTHSKYGKIQKELETLERNKENIKKLATRSELQSVAKPNPRYALIQGQLEDARLARDQRAGDLEKLDKAIKDDSQDVDRLYLVYSAIRLHSTKAERLTKELDAATLKRDDKALQARQLGSQLNDPFSITQDVAEPLKPTEPNPWLIVAFALVAGFALGLSIALSAEYGRNCFRSVHDISRVMVAPVLGNVGSIQTSRERRLRSLQRMLVGTFSATLICAVAFVTWAWARNPELLSPQLRARIEHLRDKLR